MTIVDFLLARIAEDEAVARAGISSQADPENGWGLIEIQGFAGLSLSPHVGHIHERVQGEHVIRWHPARVLAECEAKRRIVAQHRPGKEGDTCEMCTSGGPDAQGWPCDTVRYLAAVYADHPDYDLDWRL